jgi:hypothetical protein
MLINEVIQTVTESYYEDLMVAIQDILTNLPDGQTEIPTEELQYRLSELNFDLNVERLIQAVEDSGFASSQDSEVIKLKGELPADINTDVEDPSDRVGDLAGNQAMKDIKAEL